MLVQKQLNKQTFLETSPNLSKSDVKFLNQTESEVFVDYVEFVKQQLLSIYTNSKQQDKSFFLQVFKNALSIGFNDFCERYMKSFRNKKINLHIVNYLFQLNQDMCLMNQDVNSFLTIPYNIITEGQVSQITQSKQILQGKVRQAKMIMKPLISNYIENVLQENKGLKIKKHFSLDKQSKQQAQTKSCLKCLII